MKKKIIGIIAALIAVLALYRIVVFVKAKVSPEAVTEEKHIVPVKAAGVKVMDMTDSIKFTGDIKGIEAINVFSQVPGKVQVILIRQGQKVYKNQTIIKINRDIIGMDYMPGIVESPISGYVGKIMVDRGMTIAPSTPLAQIVNMSRVEAVVQLIEEDINRVQIGMKAIIEVEALPGRRFYGRVYKKSAVLDTASRTQETHVIIDNRKFHLRHGMFADVEIIAGKKNGVLAVPVDSVMRDEKETAYVYLVVKGRAKKTMVETGLSFNNYIEIKKGVEKESVVVTLGKENVSDGENLKVYRDDLQKPEVNEKKSTTGGNK